MEHSATKAAPMGEYDVAIVGTGPIGLMTANLLGLAEPSGRLVRTQFPAGGASARHRL